jgi:hypothetical protein
MSASSRRTAAGARERTLSGSEDVSSDVTIV